MFLIEEESRTGINESDDIVKGLKKAQSVTHGLFHPHLYAIGTRLDPRILARADFGQLLRYALYQKNQTAFADLVALHHETVHMIQYLSTNVGLSFLLHYAHALSYISEAPEQVSASIIIPRNENTRPDVPSLPTILNFIDYFKTEINLAIIKRLNHSEERAKGKLDYLTFEDAVTISVSRADRMTISKNRAQAIIGPGIISQGPDNLQQGHALTMGQLFETSALLSELILLHDVMREEFTSDLVWAYLNSLPYEYTVVVRLYLDHFALDRRGLVPQLLALIDIALMQDRTVTGYHEPFAFFESLDPNETPGSQFLRACEAAQRVFPVRNSGHAEALRFQNDVCGAMGVLPVYLQAQRAYMAAFRPAPISGVDGSAGSFIWNRFAPIHQEHLLRRTEADGASFIVNTLPATVQSFYTLEQSIAVYDIATSSLWDSQQDVEAMAAVVIGKEFLEPITSRRLECPLKVGKPFYCSSRGKGDFEHCSFSRRSEGTSNCPFLVYSGSILEFQEKVKRNRQW